MSDGPANLNRMWWAGRLPTGVARLTPCAPAGLARVCAQAADQEEERQWERA